MQITIEGKFNHYSKLTVVPSIVFQLSFSLLIGQSSMVGLHYLVCSARLNKPNRPIQVYHLVGLCIPI